MMKKLFRLTTIPLSLNILLKNQLSYLNQYFDITAVSSMGADLDLVKEREGVKTIALEMEREINIKKDILALIALVMLFGKHKPNIVHSNTPKSSLLSMLASKIAGVPYRIYTVTGLRFETETGAKKRILMLMEKITCYCATHVVAESRGVQKMLIDNQLTSKPSAIIGNGNINGIDEEYWIRTGVEDNEKNKLRRSLNIIESDFVFLFVGRLTASKGANELVHAFSEAKFQSNVKLIFVGHKEQLLDPLEPGVENIMEACENIIEVGFQEDVRLFMSISNVLILPSHREGFPNVILQAGAMELPCIVTYVNGAEEVIDKHNGILINKKNKQELINAMIHIKHNYSKFDKSYCRNKVVKLYSQKYYFPELLSFYQNAIGKDNV